MTITVRRLEAGDAEAYRAVRLLMLATEPAAFGTLHADEAALPLAHFAGLLAGSAVFGAFRGAELAGVVRLARPGGAKERHKGTVQGFFVRPEWRRSGVGRALMAAAMEEAARAGLERLTLSVVVENAGAIAFYARFGFQTYGVEPDARRWAGVRQDIASMTCPLEEGIR